MARRAATKHFWMKWEFARWLNEPTLVTAGNAVQGFWFNLLNRMGLAQSPVLEDTPAGFALLGLCPPEEVASRLHEIRTRGIADVEERNGRVRVTCRSMVNQMQVSETRRQAAQERWRKQREAAAALKGASAEGVQGAMHFAYAKPAHDSSSSSNSSFVSDGEVQEGKDAAPPAPPPDDVAPPFASASEQEDGDLVPMAQQIVLAHPRARMRQWGRRNIPAEALTATLAAICGDAADTGAKPLVAAMAMLAQVQTISKTVPEGEWRYLKDIPEFMRLCEYRIDPKHLIRSNGGGSYEQSAACSSPLIGLRKPPANTTSESRHDTEWFAEQVRIWGHEMAVQLRDCAAGDDQEASTSAA